MDDSLPITEAAADAAEQAKVCGLRYVSDTRPGFTRRRYGRRFIYFDTKGVRIEDEKTRGRINHLVIPPPWKDVWICPFANGHIQATGTAAKGRKQYRYHADWRSVRDATKFSHILRFGEVLPRIRAVVRAEMARRMLSREKVLASVVYLLEKTLIRTERGGETEPR